MIDIQKQIASFWIYVIDQSVDLYNEFSLQHELGVFLRNNLQESYRVQFERNVSFFGIYGHPTVKREIDIAIFNANQSERYAIELKYPRNGRHPEEMYDFTKDILFVEQLKKEGFSQTAAVTLVEDRPFYAGNQSDGIYKYFRCGAPISGTIHKPTGSTKGIEHIDIAGSYRIEWQKLDEKRRYYVVVV